MPFEIEIENQLAAICPASEKMRAFLTAAGAPEGAIFLTDLVVEELTTNTIKYGYDDEKPHRIHVSVDFRSGVLVIEVRDDGHEFDPLAHEKPDTTLPAEERGIGGLGIHLVCQMTDEIRYERVDGWNVVTATKSFPGAAAG